MRSSLSILTCLFLTLVLSGCHLGAPTFFPRGYSSYDQEFKSVSGAEARDIGYAYSNEENKAVLDDMRFAAKDLVQKLDQKLSFSVDEIYLKSSANTAFYNSFDHLLREELTQHGYMLTSVPGEAVPIEFVAKNMTVPCADSRNDSTYKDIYLALAMDVHKNVPTDFVGGFYEVPLYDYKEVGSVKIDVLSCSSGDGSN